MLLFPRSFRSKVRCCFTHVNTSGVAPLQLTETRLSGARMQRLLSHAVWDHDGVRDELRTFLWRALSPSALPAEPPASTAPFPVLVMDESGLHVRYHQRSFSPRRLARCDVPPSYNLSGF